MNVEEIFPLKVLGRVKRQLEESSRSSKKQAVKPEVFGVKVESEDEGSLRRLVCLLEKRFLKNQEMRIKFPEAPERFLESELDLLETVLELRAMTVMTEFPDVALNTGLVPRMLDLVTHANTDLVVAMLHMLDDIVTERENEALVESLLEHRLIQLMSDVLERLDEKVEDEAVGVHCVLSVLEVVVEKSSSERLVVWLLRRLRAKHPFDENKLYASELLATLVQEECNRELVVSSNGFDLLLQLLAMYKRQEPDTEREQEMLENVVDCLCWLVQDNKAAFLQAEGVQLMNLILKHRSRVRLAALKVLDHATTGKDGKACCLKLVDVLGLRVICPLFLSPPRGQAEEHVLSVMFNLLRHCDGMHKLRVLNKFLENDLEKVDRLVEYHFKYLEKVQSMNEGEVPLFCLQLVDCMILELSACGPPVVKHRVAQLIWQRGGSLKTVKDSMREYAGRLGESAPLEQLRVLQLIDKL